MYNEQLYMQRAMRGGSPYMHVDKGALSPAHCESESVLSRS